MTYDYEKYWQGSYDLGTTPSVGLVALIEQMGLQDRQFAKALDIGCGRGRNIPLIRKYSHEIEALEPNELAFVDAAKEHPDVKVDCDTLEHFAARTEQRYDLVVAWRVLHLGDLAQCRRNFECVGRLLKPRSILLTAVSARHCPYFLSTRSEPGGEEIEPGTVFRGQKNDIRHFFTLEEVLAISSCLQASHHVTFEERKGSSALKLKQYFGIAYLRCD